MFYFYCCWLATSHRNFGSPSSARNNNTSPKLRKIFIISQLFKFPRSGPNQPQTFFTSCHISQIPIITPSASITNYDTPISSDRNHHGLCSGVCFRSSLPHQRRTSARRTVQSSSRVSRRSGATFPRRRKWSCAQPTLIVRRKGRGALDEGWQILQVSKVTLNTTVTCCVTTNKQTVVAQIFGE